MKVKKEALKNEEQRAEPMSDLQYAKYLNWLERAGLLKI